MFLITSLGIFEISLLYFGIYIELN